MISLLSVSKRYGDSVALQPLSIEFQPGKVTALIGPSGCGKSTLLRMIVGLVEPDTGKVVIDGSELTRSNLTPMRRKMGYVIQDGGLFPHLTARQNVTLLADELGKKVEVEKLADLVHITPDALDRFPLELSGGQRQRVALMRALALEPELLLLDEPLGALDPLIRSELQSDLKTLFAELHKTVIFVTHDMGEAAFLADEIVLMRSGRIVQHGTLADFQERPTEPYVTEFMNAQRRVVAIA